MKQLRFKWKYLLASILLANIIACSNDDLAQMSHRQEQDSGTRTAELVSRTITLETVGMLEAKVSEAMGDAEVSTLEKLIVSGPFTSSDMQFVRDSLTGLTILDMEGVQIKPSDVPYYYSAYNSTTFLENQICYRMFYDMDNLKEVVLPSTVTIIGNDAFQFCDSLRNVGMPDALKSLGAYSFEHCSSLSTIDIPDAVEVINQYTFHNCYSLVSVNLPSSLKEIYVEAFWNCTSLEDIQLPDGLKKIHTWAFENCSSLTHLVIPNTVEEIGSYVFYNCDKLTELVIPSSVTSIGSYAFHNCNKITELVIPSSVTSIGDNFVSNCSALRALVWESSELDIPSNYGIGNCLLFVNTDQIGIDNIDSWKGIVINGLAEGTIDVDSSSEFMNVKEFTAHKLTYSRYFGGETRPGGSSGWNTIVLPFTPDSIYHETKGQIAPFGSGIEGAKPFWLRELTSEGFVDVTKIEPNKPYIIAMPNHSDYLEEYRLSGNITFIARDSVLRVTPVELQPSVGPEFELHPTYCDIYNSSDIYYLTTEWNYYEEEQMYYDKNFFKKYERGRVNKFNAYVTTLGGGRSSRTLFDLDTRSKETRAAWIPNKTGIPQIGDM